MMLKNSILTVIAFLVSGIFFAGILLITELGVRATGVSVNRAALIDVELFPYEYYVVHTQPPNTSLGTTNNIIEGYFSGGECALEDGTTARFNSNGFRSPEFPVATSKANQEIRIIITGGSASISWGISEACTLDRMLKKNLEEMWPDKTVNIYNMGSAGWKSQQEVIAVQMHGLTIEPDLIIHFSGFNDSYHPAFMPINQPYSGLANHSFARYKNWINAGPTSLLAEFRVGHMLKSALSSAPTSLSRPGGGVEQNLPVEATEPGPGRIATQFALPVNEEEIAARTDFDPFNKKVVENYIRNERILAAAAESYGAKVLSILQPTLFLKQPLGPKETEMMTYGTGFGYVPSVNFTVQAYIRLREELARLDTTHRNLYFADFSNVFDGMEKDLFGDNVHFSRQGYEFVAERLTEKIKSVLE